MFNDFNDYGLFHWGAISNELCKRIDYMFKSVPTTYTSCKSYDSSINIIEDEDNYYVKTLSAGLDKEDIDITYKVEDSVKYMYIEFKKESDFIMKGKKFIRIGEKADTSKITAKINNGILTITVPKDKSKTFDGKVNID